MCATKTEDDFDFSTTVTNDHETGAISGNIDATLLHNQDFGEFTYQHILILIINQYLHQNAVKAPMNKSLDI